MSQFFKQLPRTMAQASRLAKAHEPQLLGPAAVDIDRGLAKQELLHCVEIRHESFAVPEFVRLLRCENVGLVVADTVDWPLLMDVTADFVYGRISKDQKEQTAPSFTRFPCGGAETAFTKPVCCGTVRYFRRAAGCRTAIPIC